MMKGDKRWNHLIIVFRSILLVFFGMCMAISGMTQERTEIAAYIPHIPNLQPPVIDGILNDPVWEYSTQGRVSQMSSGWRVRINPNFDVDDPVQTGTIDGRRNNNRPEEDADASFRVWAMYDDNYLYIAVATLDYDYVNRLPSSSVNEGTWLEDSVEIFIDGNHNRVSGNVNDHPEEYATGGQFVMTSAGAIRHAEAGNPSFGNGPNDDWYAAVFDNNNVDGSNYEFRIKLSKIGNPKFGSVIGFNVAMNDADDPGANSADYQILWTGKSHNEDTYGNLEFGRRSVTAPLITAPITIDGKLDEPSWNVAGKGKGGVPYGPFEGDTIPRDLADLSFDFYVLHDANYLYVGIDVKDSEVIADSAAPGSEDGTTWYDDSAEIFIDGNHSHTPGRTGQTGFGLGGQYVITTVNAFRDNEASEVSPVLYGPDDDWYALTSLTPTGYIAEFRVLKEASMTPPDIGVIGFEIAINEDDTDPPNEKDAGYQVNWNGHPHNEASYGDLVLSGPATPICEWALY
ncbi:MAG: hypothetical protein C4527_24445 [Candidatus Omnitrophota bacterium]|jgi:hypothetical protein|nr:MAG: hypothetical protein C4527_24445 [Candidatus Omnitrophota bacterium]